MAISISARCIVVQNDFFIIDFEGEPARPLAARRRKSSPLRDVAGMIRSFDYAAVAAVRQLAEARPAAEPRMMQLAEAWRQRAVDGFRAAYRKTMRGCAAYPASKKQAREMTAFFTLEKAVYEVSYELANRPDWVDIPLKGILGILARTRGRERAAPGLTRKSRRSSRRVTTIRSPSSACIGPPTGICVRAMLPAAQEMAVVEVCDRQNRSRGRPNPPRRSLCCDHSPTAQEPFRYRLRVSSGGIQQRIRRRLPFLPGARRARHLPARRGQSSGELSEARRTSDRP